MNSLRLTIAALVAVFLCLSGCATLKSAAENAGDYIRENPVFVSIGTRTAIEFYIEQKDTLQQRIDRAKDVEARFDELLVFVDDNPSAPIDELVEYANSIIDWEELSPNDRVIVQEVVRLIEKEVRIYAEQNKIDDDVRVALRSVFEVAVSAAQVYLLGV